MPTARSINLRTLEIELYNVSVNEAKRLRKLAISLANHYTSKLKMIRSDAMKYAWRVIKQSVTLTQ